MPGMHVALHHKKEPIVFMVNIQNNVLRKALRTRVPLFKKYGGNWLLLFFFLSFLRYIPPLIWGKSGHIQTALYGKMGRVRSPHPYGHRKFITMSDGATSTFDLFEPLAEHCVGGELLQVLVLGCLERGADVSGEQCVKHLRYPTALRGQVIRINSSLCMLAPMSLNQ